VSRQKIERESIGLKPLLIDYNQKKGKTMNKMQEKIEKIRGMRAEREKLEGELDRSYDMIALMPDIFSGKCEKFSVGFDFSADGKGYKRNSLPSSRHLRGHGYKYHQHSIAIISRKDKNGDVIEEREVPARELPDSHLPSFMLEGKREAERLAKRNKEREANETHGS